MIFSLKNNLSYDVWNRFVKLVLSDFFFFAKQIVNIAYKSPNNQITFKNVLQIDLLYVCKINDQKVMHWLYIKDYSGNRYFSNLIYEKLVSCQLIGGRTWKTNANRMHINSSKTTKTIKQRKILFFLSLIKV